MLADTNVNCWCLQCWWHGGSSECGSCSWAPGGDGLRWDTGARPVRLGLVPGQQAVPLYRLCGHNRLHAHRDYQERNQVRDKYKIKNSSHIWLFCNWEHVCLRCFVEFPIRYWGSVVPDRCRQSHEGEEWNCFFGYRVFPSIKSEFIMWGPLLAWLDQYNWKKQRTCR